MGDQERDALELIYEERGTAPFIPQTDSDYYPGTAVPLTQEDLPMYTLYTIAALRLPTKQEAEDGGKAIIIHNPEIIVAMTSQEASRILLSKLGGYTEEIDLIRLLIQAMPIYEG